MGYESIVENTGIKQTNLYDRVRKLLISDEWSDCCFTVSGKDFKAHKLILGISSPVFEAMFYGPLSTDNIVVITDIEPDIFQLVLNYIYTDKVNISSIEEAFELLYASRKYILDHLSDLCVAYIQENICIDNVVEVLNYPEYLHDEQLKSFAVNLFCAYANHLFQENNEIILPTSMRAILESDNINMSEVDLIKHVVEWTRSYCKGNEILESIENRRDVLINNGLFDLLRFHALSLDEFLKIQEHLGKILLAQEIENLKLVLEGKPVLDKLILKPRTPFKLQWHQCTRKHLRSVAPLYLDSFNHTIHVRVKASKSVFITAVCIPTRMMSELANIYNLPNNYTERITLSIVAESDSKSIRFMNFANRVEYNFYADLEFSEPYLLKKNEWYKISFRWPQHRHHTDSYIVELRDKIVFNDPRIVFEFDDLSTGIFGSFLEGLKYCL